MIWLVGVVFAAEGIVRERGGSAPVAGATVQVQGQTVQSGPDGRFEVDLGAGPVTLLVEAEGYLPQELQWSPGEPLQIWMVSVEGPPEIVVEAQRELPHMTGQVLDQERVRKTPGTYEDAVRLVQALPGVVVTPEYSPSAGVIAVRGAAPQESRFYLDGVKLPYLFHFNEYSSVLHTRVVDELALYPSTYGATWGNGTGGVVEVRSKVPRDPAIHGGVSWNLVMAGAWMSAPVGDRVRVTATARRSYMDFAGGESSQYTVWPTFWDYLGRTDVDLGDHKVVLSAVGGGDSYGRYAGDVEQLDALEQTQNPEMLFDRAFHSVSLRVSDSLESAELRTSVAFVSDSWGAEVAGASQLRLDRYLWIRHETLLVPSDRLVVSVGLDAEATQLHRFTDSSSPLPQVGDEAPILAAGIPVDEVLSRGVYGLWVEPRIDIGGWHLQPGARVLLAAPGVAFGVDPRLSARYQPAELWRLRAAAGRYSMAPPLDALSPTTGDPDLERTLAVSDQASVGADLAVAGRWELGLDLWGKRFQGLVLDRPVPLDGHAVGVELTSRYRLRELFFAWASLSFGKAVQGESPFDFDQPFAATVVFSWDFRDKWNTGLRWRYAVGLPYTPIEGSLYQGSTDTWTPVLGATNSARLANYQKLDLHLERSFTARRFTTVAYAELWVVPPRNNAMYLVYSYDYSESATVAGPSLLPLVGVRADF